MIVLNLMLNGIYGFDDFHINFTYPKKIINSLIEDENLKGRERFRYKKAVILMGANATGKTSLGKALLRIFGYMESGNPVPLCEMAAREKGDFTIDFVNGDYRLQRLHAKIDAVGNGVEIRYQTAEIGVMDSYEKCLAKLVDHTDEATRTATSLKKLIGEVRYRFAYPEIEKTLKLTGMNKRILLKTLRAVIGTLDPTLQDVSLAKDLKDTFIIRRDGTEIIIQEGKLLNREVLSSGTAEGIDVAMFLAAMIAKEGSFYYCDEHFSYIQSDIEKRIFGIMLDHIGENEQMIFTTHNTDMLDLNLPKHSYTFLRKQLEDGVYKVSAISASEVLKRNTDSIRNAVENDVFSSLPQDSLLDELELEVGK
ncbi:MAG: DNA repair protein Rad50 [Lachnospiraceae bacterium]|nr:DNA repair protein Rad50 [Lachnospiraceae bacterium]